MDSPGSDRPPDEAAIGGSAYGWLKGMDDWLFRSNELVPEGDPAARDMWSTMPEPHRRDLQWMAASMGQVPRHPVDAIVVLALMKKRRRRLQKERPRRVALTVILLTVPWVLTAAGLWPLSRLAVGVGTGGAAIVVVGLVVHRAWWERRFRSMVWARASRLHGGG